MKYMMLFIAISVTSYANILKTEFFDAEFTQTITDDKNKMLSYKGHIQATKPHFVLWNYITPIQKKIYISDHKVVIIEPEIEQVIIKNIEMDFNFFNIINNAIQIDTQTYKTIFNNTEYEIKMNASKLFSISYVDKFENKVKISFSNQAQNKKIPLKTFIPKIPTDYDIIKE